MSAPASAPICWYAANGGTHCLGSVRGGFGVTCPSRGVGAACCKACDKAAVKQPGLFTVLQFSLCRGQHGRFFVFHGVSMGGSLCFMGASGIRAVCCCLFFVPGACSWWALQSRWRQTAGWCSCAVVALSLYTTLHQCCS
jgi:hypothetical protein